MTHLSLSFLGFFQVTLAGQMVSGFSSDKVRALLAYLALEAKQVHRRETLLGLFWPERPERQARQSLSQALSNLRHLLEVDHQGPPFILADYQTVQFNPASDYELDVDRLASLVLACDRHPPSQSGKLSAVLGAPGGSGPFVCWPTVERVIAGRQPGV